MKHTSEVRGAWRWLVGATVIALAFMLVLVGGCGKKGTNPTPASIQFVAGTLVIDSVATTATLILRNYGDKPGSYLLNETSDWLTLAKTSGDLDDGEQETISATVSRTGLSPDTYHTSITVATAGSVTDTLAVSMIVPGAPLMHCSPDTLDFGSMLTTLTLTISNVGTATGIWSLNQPVTWLTYTASGSLAASGQESVTVTTNRSGKAAGTYQAPIVLSTGTTGTDTVVATMAVVPARILASRDTIWFYCYAYTETDTFTLSNVSQTSAAFSLSPLED